MTFRAWCRLAMVAIGVVIVQGGILQQVSIGGAHPDAFLLMAIAAGLVAGPRAGAVVAFCWGLLADVFVLTPFGLSALCFVLVAAGVGELTSSGGYGSRATAVFTVVCASFLGSLLFAGLLLLVGQPHLPVSGLIRVLVVVAVSNGVLAVPAVAATRFALSGTGQLVREFAAVGGTR